MSSILTYCRFVFADSRIDFFRFYEGGVRSEKSPYLFGCLRRHLQLFLEVTGNFVQKGFAQDDVVIVQALLKNGST